LIDPVSRADATVSYPCLSGIEGKKRTIVADEPVSRIPRTLPHLQQVPHNQQIESVKDVSLVSYDRIRGTESAHSSAESGETGVGVQASEFPRKQTRGRKRTDHSRAAELCAKLAAWMQAPESARSSLRALARELGTSHQLLSHYLQCWDKWQAREYRQQAEEIRARTTAETRPWVLAEMLDQANAYDKAAFRSMIAAVLGKALRQLRGEAGRGQLSAAEVKMLKAFARTGHREAQEILAKK
jgi:hypothetical protein